jgi:hypothetical protein
MFILIRFITIEIINSGIIFCHVRIAIMLSHFSEEHSFISHECKGAIPIFIAADIITKNIETTIILLKFLLILLVYKSMLAKRIAEEIN